VTEVDAASPPAEEEPNRGTEPLMLSPKLIAAVVCTILVLIVAVVTVGLLRNNLDPAGVLTVLSTLLSSVVVGFALRGRTGGGAK